MKIKKELLLSCLLILLSLGLVIASDGYQPDCKPKAGTPVKNCNKRTPSPGVNPWNFLTEGVLKLATV